jgi:hypothetical protein
MTAPTSTYVNYATGTGHGNDYKGATFTNGAYTSATKTLTKASAFAASQVNHWLYLESNDGGSIVAGFYKIADITGAPNAVILATDAGAGVDDDAAKCTQHDGTTTLPWRSVQGALDLITRDATNGDQVNVKAGTAQVNQAALTLARYGAPAAGVPLVIRGYTTAANDGGVGEIDCNGAKLFAVATLTYTGLVHLAIHNFGNNTGIDYSASGGTGTYMYSCEVHKGASTPTSKRLIYYCQRVVGCYIHDAGTTSTGIDGASIASYNYVFNCPTGIVLEIASVVGNLIVGSTVTGISATSPHAIMRNSIYCSTAATGKGIYTSGTYAGIIVNNIVEGYSGAGGIGINVAGDVHVIGYNAFFNNTTPQTNVNVYTDLTANDVTLASSAFVDAANGNFALSTAVAGAIDGAFPGALPGLATTVDHGDIGAVQNGAGSGSRHINSLWLSRL